MRIADRRKKMRPENYIELKRNYLILFAIIFVAGIIVILRSDSINMSMLLSTSGFDQNTIVFGFVSWIVVGSIFSLLSGFAIINLLLKDIVRKSAKDENEESPNKISHEGN
jgi:membrane protein YqaA with SNARE-associated domain